MIPLFIYASLAFKQTARTPSLLRATPVSGNISRDGSLDANSIPRDISGGRTSDAAAVQSDAGPDRACYRYRRDRWIVAQSAAEFVYKLVGVRRGVAKVGHKWGNFGLCWCGWQTVGSAPIEESFHGVANGRDGCTMVPFSRSKRRFRLRR